MDLIAIYNTTHYQTLAKRKPAAAQLYID